MPGLLAVEASILLAIGSATARNETIEARWRGKFPEFEEGFSPLADEPRMKSLRKNAYQIKVLCST